MTPIPYKSIWTDKVHYLIKCIIRNNIQFALVPNGNQPDTGILFPNIKEAKEYIKENGFSPLTS